MTTASDPQWSFETLQIHAGRFPDPTTGARALPIYQTTSYQFKDADHAAALFALEEPGNIYTRINNPTQTAVEEQIAALEGGVGALLLASGQAATTYAILNVAQAGDHIVSSPRLYGGTYNLIGQTLSRVGIEVTFIDNPDDLEQWKSAIRPNTKALFGETISNPKNDILDLENISQLAHENHIPLIVDNTVATPYGLRPSDFGADIIVHSATKYLGGHGNSIAGVIVDSGKFDWAKHHEASGKFPDFFTPDPSYNGLRYGDLGPAAFVLKARLTLLRDLGAAISPFNVFLLNLGIETLSLRVQRHFDNAQKVAEFLEQHPQVESVNYAGLPSSPWHERAKKLTPRGSGAVLSFEIKGGHSAGKKFVEALKLHSHVANIGDVRSLVIHPASTTHSQLTPEQLEASGTTPGLVRLAVGIENVNDIINDLKLGFSSL